MAAFTGIPKADYKKLQESATAYMWGELDPLAEKWDEIGKVPREKLWPEFRDQGFWGLVTPKEYGGIGLNTEQYIWFEKEWAKLHGGIRVILHVHSLGADIINHFAPKKIKEELLPRIAKGESSVAFALTERNAGTGKDIKTQAEKVGNNYILKGEKHLITNANFTDYFCVVCRTTNGWSQLLVPRDTPGFVIKDMPETMGCAGGYHGILEFNECKVPAENILGVEGKGLDDAIQALRVSRIYIAANALGVCERCLELSIKKAKERITFGKPIAERQAVQGYLAEMAANTHCAELAVLNAARRVDETGVPGIEADLCKVFAIEAVKRVTDLALLVHGGLGYTREYPIARLYRDCRLNWLEEGTPTIHQFEIARRLLAGERSEVCL